MPPKLPIFLATAALFLGLDQWSKWWVRANLAEGDTIPVLPNFLAITHATNKGAAFSFLNDFEYRLQVFYAFTALAVFVIVQSYRQLAAVERVQAFALGAILSGALGNFVDRVAAGQVTDMVKVYAGADPWRTWARTYLGGRTVYPIWNVADAAIFVGVGVFALLYLFDLRKKKSLAAAE
jgi:signal peptidase II